MRRVPTYYQDLIDKIGANPGLVIGSTACLGGFLGTKLIQARGLEDNQIEHIGFMSKIKVWLKQIENIFGVGNFFLEMQPSPDKDQIYVNQHIAALSKALNIPYIITTDSHYLNKEDAPIHEAFLNSQEGDREVASFYQTTYLMGTEELESFLNSYLMEEEIQEAYRNIKKIKDMCEDFSFKKPLKIPSLEWRQPTINSEIIAPLYYDDIPYLKKFLESSFEGDIIMSLLIVDRL